MPIAHWVWNPDGWLKGLGAIDFAGGIVVHVSAGLSALAAALVVGRRKGCAIPWKSHMKAIDKRPRNRIQTHQHPLCTARCSVAVVWLVRLQRRQRTCSKRLSRLSTRHHKPCSSRSRSKLDACRLGNQRQTIRSRHRNRSSRWIRRHHTSSRLRQRILSNNHRLSSRSNLQLSGKLASRQIKNRRHT